MKKISEAIFGQKIDGQRIYPLSTKIIFIFILFILVSNFSSHYISLELNRTTMVSMMKQLLVKDLKEAYNFANSQYEIYQVKKIIKDSAEAIELKVIADFKNQNSIFLGVRPSGDILFQASKIKKYEKFRDTKTLNILNENLKKKIFDGFMSIQFNNQEYFGVFKYNPKWNLYLIRAEELNEFFKESRESFKKISIIIIVIALLCAVIGMFLMRYILRFLKVITNSVIQMTKNQELGLIELSKAPADDITFLGVAFNSLSNTINNLINIFRKFTNKDIVVKAYKERHIKLEGKRRELTCLFSDIKSFTYMTEVLGTDIITLLNLHYNKAIHAILEKDGIIGSIIGDALLAVYGVFDEPKENKSYQSILSAYEIHEVAKSIREQMKVIHDRILEERGYLTEKEEKVYKAVLIQVGVGIDGGLVFYGNIGSKDRMTNTVIGDNVNSSSRLEGLTRIYQVPVICSDYVKDDIENNVENHGLEFIELDMVQVKGKTIGKTVYWPVFSKDLNDELTNDIKIYSKALPLYYQGKWKEAHPLFKKCSMEMARVFEERTQSLQAPKNWNGIWAMTSK